MTAEPIVKLAPLESAAWRLERLFGGRPPTETPFFSPSLPPNLPKVLQTWLGSASGAAATATLDQIGSCAQRLLDPTGICATGRDILSSLTTDRPVYSEGLVQCSREIEAWLVSLAVKVLWRSSRVSESCALCEKGLLILDAHWMECERYVGEDRTAIRTTAGLPPLRARLLRYRSLLSELAGKTEDLREDLARRYRMAVLRKDGHVSCTVLNLMLRELLRADQVEQAQKLLSNATFPTELPPSNNQLLRYLYYSGRIEALRLEYTQSYSHLSQALRKCPTNTGLGFRIAIQRTCVVVQLLMGEIPDLAVFYTEGMQGEMRPYLEIAQAVRKGDLVNFQETVSRQADRFRQDGMYTLISRLAHSVIKAGLRRLKTSYSRISLEDVAVRLGLSSATSAEFVVAKAVRDGVIDATIDHEGGYVQSHDLMDVYATVEPSEAFHRRIAYCLTTHNDALRGMRYHEDAYKKQMEKSRGLKRRGGDGKAEKALELDDDMEEDY